MPNEIALPVQTFVKHFTDAWADPTPERLLTLVHADVELVQPLSRKVVGHVQVARWLSRTFAIVPDLRGEVLSWAYRDDVLFIEVRLRATIGRRTVEWIAVDRITLDGDKVRRRVAHFDPTPLILPIVLSPRTLLRAGSATLNIRL
ncbi:nuclear transport factor 2 family protein [Nocardia sp. XZ_19_385]|uniref:nuclear transport factor 2 family protein n=1 Tax=Nocardia sp. XZ_19_385 TaxID=2769488 RepID=UPI00188FA72E|nr:nuclear transport factor 2 family protein [Nocardia sp. XZ_19_385]